MRKSNSQQSRKKKQSLVHPWWSRQWTLWPVIVQIQVELMLNSTWYSKPSWRQRGMETTSQVGWWGQSLTRGQSLTQSQSLTSVFRSSEFSPCFLINVAAGRLMKTGLLLLCLLEHRKICILWSNVFHHSSRWLTFSQSFPYAIESQHNQPLEPKIEVTTKMDIVTFSILNL